jgi:hypothetical protein
MIDAFVNYLNLAYPSAVQLSKGLDNTAISMMKGFKSVEWPESTILDKIEAYSQDRERETHPITGEWPSLDVVDSPIMIRIE